MKKIFLKSMAVLLSGLMLGGCAFSKEGLSVKNISEQTVCIKKDGSIEAAYVEDFDKSYYDVEELRRFVANACTDYNAGHGSEAVSLSAIELDEKEVKAILVFRNQAAYDLFPQRAVGSDIMTYDSDKALKEFAETKFYKANDKSEELFLGKDIFTDENMGVVCVNGPLVLETSGKMLYYTAGTLLNSNNLKIAEGETSVVVFKKYRK